MNQVITPGTRPTESVPQGISGWPSGTANTSTPLPDGRQSTFTTARLSNALLKLYDLAQRCSLPDFQTRAMQLLAEELPFDSGWFGRSTFADNEVRVHCSHLQNLPADVPSVFKQIDAKFGIASQTIATPERAVIFTRKEMFARPTGAVMADYMQAANALCITTIDRHTGLMNFIAINRRNSSDVYREAERQLLELLMPHLVAALDLCCSMELARRRQATLGGVCVMATTDGMGFLHAMDSDFVGMLRREWPQWNGERLPSELLRHINGQHRRFVGEQVHGEFTWSGDHVLLTLSARQRHDTLTAQERAVANAFSSGQSYKAVARCLHLAPATVRHHLRSVYRKLGVSDKAALVQKLSIGKSSAA